MDAFGFVILTAILSIFLLFYLGIQVGKMRAKLKLPYPDQYFPDQKLFNCYQRAHQNTLENYPTFLVLLFAGGNLFPLVSSVAGVIWIIGRVLYAQGYYTGDPKNRMRGGVAYIGLLTLLVCSLLNALDRLGVVDF